MLVTDQDLPAIEQAALHLQQLFDISDAIDLELARAALTSTSTRMRPVATRGGSIDMPQLPVVVSVGDRLIVLGSQEVVARVTARIYDLGIVAITLTIPFTASLTWLQAIDLLAEAQARPHATDAQARPQSFATIFTQVLEILQGTIRSAIQQPNSEVRTEDYTVFTIARLGPGLPASRLAGHPLLLRAALAERRPLSASAGALATALSYYDDDLIVLTWAAALVIEPDAAAREDALFLLEFANVQLLAFRSYDAQVEHDLARIAPGVTRRRRPRWWMMRSTTVFLHEIHSLISETSELSSRVENALKVTEDVYWNRVYTAAVGVLRVDVWRSGLAESLDVLRATASLLNDEAESARAAVLEILVIVLIAIELVVALIGLRH